VRDVCMFAIFSVGDLVLMTNWALGGLSVVRRWRSQDTKVGTDTGSN
jgi:hypothetical protein